MSFDFEAAQTNLTLAKRFVSEAPAYIAQGDYASVKYCAYYVFYYSMLALLLGSGVPVGRHSEAVEHIRLYYMDTGIISDRAYPFLQLGLQIHNLEAYDDPGLCGNEEALDMMNAALKFCEEIARMTDHMKALAKRDSVGELITLLRQNIRLAEAWSALLTTEADSVYTCFCNDYDLYVMARDTIRLMLCQGYFIFDELMEIYAICCLRIIRWLKSRGESVEEEQSKVAGICLKLARSDMKKWGRDAADLCEAIADTKEQPEADRLYRKALALYQSLYADSGDDWDLQCIELLRFKLDED